MIKKVFSNLSSVGVKEENDFNDNRKIKLSNQVAIICILAVGLPSAFQINATVPELTYIPLLGTVVLIFGIGLNWVGITHFSRVVISVTPFCLGYIYNALITPAGAELLLSSYAVTVSLMLIPFIVFDLSEKKWLFSVVGAMFLLMVFFVDTINGFLESDVDYDVVRETANYEFSMFIAMVFMFAAISVLVAENYTSRLNTEKLVREMDKRNEELTEQEKQLRDNLKQIEEKQEEEKRRNWASEGIAKFSNLMRSNLSGDEIHKQVVYELTKYIGANQCWMFLVNDENNDITLDLMACYAYDRHKFMEKSIAPGEGLAGQAYLEKRHIYLLDIPKNYNYITSGLGEAPPSCILIMPLVINEQVEGVFEIASFKKFEDFEIEFVREVGEAIASFVSVNKINEKTKTLLEDTQQQAEEMRSQEEEMRQNMEELAATQEEMQRKEQEYVNKIEELERELGKHQNA